MQERYLCTEKCLKNDKIEFMTAPQKLLEFLGYTRQEAAELFEGSFFQMIIPKDRQRIQKELAEKAAGEDFCLEFQVQTAGGRNRTLHARGCLLLEEEREIFCFQLSEVRETKAEEISCCQLLGSLKRPAFLLDSQKRLLYLNAAALQYYGKKASEVLGKTCDCLKTPLCGTENCCLARYLRGAAPGILQSPQGRYYQLHFSPIYDKEGRLLAYAAISAEITDLISGEKHLKEQEIRLAFALRKTDSMIWEIEFSEEGIFLAEMYGKSGGMAASSPAAVFSAQKFTPESLLSRGLIHPDSARELHRTLQALERGVTGTQCQLRLKDSSGEYRWTQVYFNTVFDETGRPLRAFGVTKDINREKELEQRLAMERQYRESLTNDTMCVYEASLTRDKLLNSSREWSEMLGLSPNSSYSSLVAAAKKKAVHPDDRQKMERSISRDALLREFSLGKRVVRCEYRRLDEKAHMIWVMVTIYLIRDEYNGDIRAFFYLKDIDEQKRRELALESKAELDSLTGALNRSGAQKRITQHLLRPQTGLSAMFMLDIDNFKQINDTYGHLFGDEVLARVVRNLEQIFRRNDVICRLGGDEFLVFITDIPERQTAERKAGQICWETPAVDFPDGSKQRISLSVGISFFPEDAKEYEELYRMADIALYQAKKQGKNRWAVYEKPEEGERGAPFLR